MDRFDCLDLLMLGSKEEELMRLKCNSLIDPVELSLSYSIMVSLRHPKAVASRSRIELVGDGAFCGWRNLSCLGL